MDIRKIIKEEIENFKNSIINVEDDILNALMRYAGGKMELSQPGDGLSIYDNVLGEPLYGEQNEYDIIFNAHSDVRYQSSKRFPSSDPYDSDYELAGNNFEVSIEKVKVYDEEGEERTFVPEGEFYDKLAEALENALSLDYNGEWVPRYNARGEQF